MNLPVDRMRPIPVAECVKTFGPSVVYLIHYDNATARWFGAPDQPRPDNAAEVAATHRGPAGRPRGRARRGYATGTGTRPGSLRRGTRRGPIVRSRERHRGAARHRVDRSLRRGEVVPDRPPSGARIAAREGQMRYRLPVVGCSLFLLALLPAAPAASQARGAAAEGWTAPRTAWGDPDLQGQWNSQTSTPAGTPPRRAPGGDGHADGRRGGDHRGDQSRELRSAAPRGQRRQLQRLLAGHRCSADAHLPDRRSARRADSPAVARG